MTSIFADKKSNLFRTYRAEIAFRDRIVGATPSDPKLIEGWLRSKMGLTREDEIRELTVRTLVDLGLYSTEDESELDTSFQSLSQAAETIAKKSQTQRFKRDEHGLYIEDRIVKAMLREVVSILFPYQAPNNAGKWGPTRKAARSFFVERVFVNPSRIHLGVAEPTGIDLFVGHVSGPQGPRSTLGYYEYVERARCTFDVIVMKDEVKDEQWGEIWALAEEIGLGAMRSQSFGRFDVEAWGPTTLTNGRVDALLATALR